MGPLAHLQQPLLHGCADLTSKVDSRLVPDMTDRRPAADLPPT